MQSKWSEHQPGRDDDWDSARSTGGPSHLAHGSEGRLEPADCHLGNGRNRRVSPIGTCPANVASLEHCGRSGLVAETAPHAPSALRLNPFALFGEVQEAVSRGTSDEAREQKIFGAVNPGWPTVATA
jgi:hypothetical protein